MVTSVLTPVEGEIVEKDSVFKQGVARDMIMRTVLFADIGRG